jgi:hypothetical protein
MAVVHCLRSSPDRGRRQGRSRLKHRAAAPSLNALLCQSASGCLRGKEQQRCVVGRAAGHAVTPPESDAVDRERVENSEARLRSGLPRVVVVGPHIGDQAIDDREYMCDRLDFLHPGFSYEGADLLHEYHRSASEHRDRLCPQSRPGRRGLAAAVPERRPGRLTRPATTDGQRLRRTATARQSPAERPRGAMAHRRPESVSPLAQLPDRHARSRRMLSSSGHPCR